MFPPRPIVHQVLLNIASAVGYLVGGGERGVLQERRGLQSNRKLTIDLLWPEYGSGRTHADVAMMPQTSLPALNLSLSTRTTTTTVTTTTTLTTPPRPTVLCPSPSLTRFTMTGETSLSWTTKSWRTDSQSTGETGVIPS